MMSFEAFRQANSGLTRAALSSRLREPHLFLWTRLNDESDERPTSQFLTMAHPTGAAARDAGPSPVPVAVLPVRKRADGNAFTLMITIGRAPNNDLVLADRRVSKFHAYVRRLGDAWTISDANSTNGTRVDDVPVPPERSVQLRSGARILLGGAVSLEFLEGPDLVERALAS
jgi:pSer/pThr/pTyr-binding forkhead associated (FHA) protein